MSDIELTNSMTLDTTKMAADCEAADRMAERYFKNKPKPITPREISLTVLDSLHPTMQRESDRLLERIIEIWTEANGARRLPH